MNMILSSNSSSSSSQIKRYHVFPSFHGPDVRRGFLSYLHNLFARKGITTFKDQEIVRGHTIGSELVQAIRESRISVVLLSKNYASSSWCLDELVEIIKCEEDSGQMVMTIFYNVDPSDVRKQRGDFGSAFGKTCQGKTEEEKQRWSQALAYVATIAGEHSLNWDEEAAMAEKFVTDVSNKLNVTLSKDFDNMVGLQAHLRKVNTLLCLESDEVKMIGIWGPAGIGKTTIARALYNQLSSERFEVLKRQFLVEAEEICDVLANETGTGSIIGISFDMSKISGRFSISGRAFEGMRNLRFLSISGGDSALQISEDLEYLPRLRLLCWSLYPRKSLPPTFQSDCLVELCMIGSKLEKLWGGIQPLANLKNIDMTYSHNLKEIPNLSKATNLETLSLHYCTSLVELPSSIRNLHKLTTLEMKYCTKLQVIPTNINLASLERVDMRGCSRLRSFPDISSNINCLDVEYTNIIDVPASVVGSWLRLEKLSMGRRSLLTHVPEGVRYLDLSSSDMKRIPDCVIGLIISDCRKLETLILDASNCESLKSVSFSFYEPRAYNTFYDRKCLKLEKESARGF